jgi:hypothetical protein
MGLVLKITNKSQHDWPELVAVIPCFNPEAGLENRSRQDCLERHQKDFGMQWKQE